MANAVKTDKALNEFASAEKYVPSIIAKMLPSWGKGSSVGVTYNYQNTPSDYVLEYRTVTNTSLGDKDYEALWGEGSPVKFLAPAHAPATVLPGWLAGQYKDAAKVILCWWITNMTMLTLNLQVRICTLRTLKRLKRQRYRIGRLGAGDIER